MIVRRLGDFADDPVPLLTRLLASDSVAYKATVVAAICRLEPAVAAPLVEPLIGFLAGIDVRPTPPRAFVNGVVALRRIGREDAIEKLTAGFTPRQSESLRRNLAVRPPGYTAETCLD